MKKYLCEKLDKVGLKIPNILLPNKSVDLNRFSVIAADQFTQDIGYWDKVKEYVGKAPSTINLIYPEAELEKVLSDKNADVDAVIDEKVKKINDSMLHYIDENIYEEIGECFIYVERYIRGKIRRGLVAAIDLEKYDYNDGAKSLIRATEKTVKERLKVRKKIRNKAHLDMPHIQVVINDKQNNVFDYIKNIKFEKPLYDFELMLGSGHIKGYKIDNVNDIENIADKLLKLKNDSYDNFLYAVGDGNHSLAAAKDIYNDTGRGRYALVEIINIYDDGLEFFPIHRLIIEISKGQFEKETGIDTSEPPNLQDLQKVLDKFNYRID